MSVLGFSNALAISQLQLPLTIEPNLSSNHLEWRMLRLRHATPVFLILCTTPTPPPPPYLAPSTSAAFFVTLQFSDLVPYVLILKMFHIKSYHINSQCTAANRRHEKTSYVSNYVFITLLHEWVERGQMHQLEKLCA